MERVLIVRFSALGDLVLTTGPLRILRKKNPQLKIDLLTSEIGLEIFHNDFDLDNTYILPKGSSLFEMISFYKKLPQYETVLDLQGNFKSKFLKFFLRSSFFSIEKHSRQRRAFVKRRKHKELLNQHVVEKYFKVFSEAFDFENENIERLRPVMFPQNFSYSKKDFNFTNTIAIHPYASQLNKEWPKTKELIDQLTKKDFNIVILGSSEKEMDLPQNNKILNMTNKTTLREMSSILAHCKALVTTDSGPMHMGISVNTPTLALFGPTTKEFGFYPNFKNTHVSEIKDLDCRPCHVHGGQSCPLNHHKCMEDISVEQVIADLENLIKNQTN